MQTNLMLQFLTVGAGGFVGAGLRFLVGTAVQRALPAAIFPYGTMAVNVLGCLLIGFIVAWREPLEPALRLFLVVGVLGGFTTYSAFALETLMLAQQQEHTLAFINIVVKLGMCLAAVWGGYELGRVFAG